MNIACSTTVASLKPFEEALSYISGLGFEYVDILACHGWAHIDPAAIIDDIGGAARGIGNLLRRFSLKPSGLNANPSRSFVAADASDREIAVTEALGLVRLARELSIPTVTFQPGSIGSKEDRPEAFRRSVECLAKVVEFARQAKVIIAIEPHYGSIAERYDDAVRFATSVPGLTFAYDPSHFAASSQDLKKSTRLFPYVSHVHLRDGAPGTYQTAFGKGVVDFWWLFEALDGYGYQGAYAIEYLDNNDGEIDEDIAEVKSILDKRYRKL